MRSKTLILATVAAIVAAVSALALSRSSTTRGAPADGKTAHLKIANYTFVPAGLTVTAGTSITVTNSDSTPHTATARSGAFDSGTLRPGRTARFTLRKPGSYIFYCQFHAFMTGTIKVR
ncbi:MAG TPA: cupredoxin domain-containing protein [Solirubrobacteraceae bacterium]